MNYCVIEELDKKGINLQETILNLKNQGYEGYYDFWIRQMFNRMMMKVQLESIEKYWGKLK